MAVNATKGARDLAEEIGVDLNRVIGTGKDGLITKKDVTSPLKEVEEPTSEIEEAPEEKPKIEKIPDKVKQVNIPAPVTQPKGAPQTEEDVPFFDRQKTVSDDNLLHLVRYRGKIRWLTKQQITVTMRDPKVKAITDNSLTEAEMLRQDVYYMEFPKYSQFSEKKT